MKPEEFNGEKGFISRVSKIIKKNKNEKKACVVLEKKHPIESTLTEGILRIPLVSKALIENEISRLSFKDEVTEIYIAGVQLLVKAYFREGINSPIELLITDGRIISNV